jgi:GMP reductase
MIHLDYDDVLINPKPSKRSLLRSDVKIEIDGIVPVVIANMPSTGTYKIAKLLAKEKIVTFIHKEYSIDEHLRFLLDPDLDIKYVGITSGVREKDIEKTTKILEKVEPNFINIDIANVYANLQGMANAISYYKNHFPNCQIVAGNIANTYVLDELINAGADWIKIGVGPGAACKTRSEIGVGVPQFSAVQEVSKRAKELGAKTIADGGCVTSGDVCKAIAAGADMVMIAGMVSKSEECDNIVEIDGKKYVNFYGLGSTKQYNKHGISDKEYRPNEGRDLLIPCKGSILDVTNQIKGALRSVCTYVGVDDIADLHDNAEFIRVNHQINNSLAIYEV